MRLINALQRCFTQQGKFCTYQRYKYLHHSLRDYHQCNLQRHAESSISTKFQSSLVSKKITSSQILPRLLPMKTNLSLGFIHYKPKPINENIKNTVNLLGYRRQIHTLNYVSNKKEDIPDYLEGNVSAAITIDEDLFDDEFDEDIQNELEDDIIDFLSSRAVIYEETDTSFIVQCPTCNHDEYSTRTQDIFVDKNSGYFVCPWCHCAGSWEELMELLDSCEDCLSAEQLKAFNDSTIPLNTAEASVHPILKNVTAATIRHFKVAVSNDGTRLIVPVRDKNGSIVGFESIANLNSNNKVIHRYLSGNVHCISHSELMAAKKMVIVSDALQVMCLAEHNIPAVSLPGDPELVKTILRNGNHNEVILWLNEKLPPRHILLTCMETGISCSIVKFDDWHSPSECGSAGALMQAIHNAQPLVYKTIATFQQFKDVIYHRLTHKHEVNGIQWKRYCGLNDLLLGHRPGELTVVTGPTGSGKTTLMAEYSLDLCSQGVSTLWGSFELSAVRLCEIMLQQFHGKLPPEDEDEFNRLAHDFSQLPLHFLTYHGQQNVDAVLKAMVDAVGVWGVQHVIIDNLQFMLGFNEKVLDRWWEQDRAVQAFRKFATLNNCHLTLIVHPKKVQWQLLSLVSCVVRAKCVQDIQSPNTMTWLKYASTRIQTRRVVKNRYGGQLGVLPLRFHKESLTLSSFFTQK
ncbi:unnamed protein product, partial [Meganyctiphanes norvegica]